MMACASSASSTAEVPKGKPLWVRLGRRKPGPKKGTKKRSFEDKIRDFNKACRLAHARPGPGRGRGRPPIFNNVSISELIDRDKEKRKQRGAKRMLQGIEAGTCRLSDLMKVQPLAKRQAVSVDTPEDVDWLDSVPLSRLSASLKPKDVNDRRKPQLTRKPGHTDEKMKKNCTQKVDQAEGNQEAMPAEANQHVQKKNMTLKKKKTGTKTKRTGVRPCAKCMEAAMRTCADCSAHVGILATRIVRKAEHGFEVAFVGVAGENVRLCAQCTGQCGRTYEQLGNRQWERALGMARHCKTCEPRRHPVPEDLSNFKRAHLAELRTEKETYSATCRRGFDSQQKTLGRISAGTGKSKTNLAARWAEAVEAPLAETGPDQADGPRGTP